MLRRKMQAQGKALERSEARFRELFDSNIVGLTLASFAGDIKDANDAFLNLVGYSREEMLAGRLNWRALTPPEYLALDELELAELQRTGRARPIEKAFIRKDGSRVPVIVGVALLETSSEGIAFALDLSERKRNEEALRRSDARLRRLLQSNIVGTHFATLEGDILAANDAFLDMIGYTQEELEAGGIRWTDLTPSEYAKADEAAVTEIRHRGASKPYEKAYLRKDGTRVPVLIGAALLEDGSEEYAAFVYDLTERKLHETEQARLVAEAQEARLIAEAAEQTATRALKARDEFIGIASHELRTPISALQLQVQVLQRSLENNTGEPVAADRVRRVLELVSRQSSRLLELVSNLMDVTRLTSGRLELEPTEVDLCQVTQTVVERLDGAIKQARCAIVMEDGCPATGFWDSFRLEQVVTNLLSNALKYGAGKPIEIGVYQKADTVTLTVMDQGIGIAREDQEKIFAPFERASDSHTSSSLGLGLYITDQIVRAHGGSIRVESEPGRGATFEVQLPRQPVGDGCPTGSPVQCRE